MDEAKETLENLLSELGMTGYTCDGALDMSVERIRELGSSMNAMRLSGEMGGNSPQYDYDAATAAEEGYYLSYHKYGSETGDKFSAYAYVTENGVVCAALRDMYIQGEVYATPETLVSPQSVVDALPGAIAQSRFSEHKLVSVQSVSLIYEPIRAENKQDGMVLSPVWLVQYVDAESIENARPIFAGRSSTPSTARCSTRSFNK